MQATLLDYDAVPDVGTHQFFETLGLPFTLTVHPHAVQGWIGTLLILVSNDRVRPADGSANCPRLGDPITQNDAPVSIQISAPYMWVAAAPALYTSGLVAVHLLGAQFVRFAP